ncbi:MAG: hypothetical protein CVV23_07380 [Ignavibacteriae bacterium HGW-Ignavibacteriae-2]|nr:TolC family protein [Bacteroidota bacterium]PKL88985.1 MAG: hypothetical protein CVV23_07380 [Ignavibacteriae bacterium HGW-Ignavibacteriae-2]
MRISKWIFMFFLFEFSVGVLYGQQKIFTLEEAINTVLKNNRDVLVAKMNVEKANAAVDEAFGYALPSLDVSGNLAHMLEKPKTPFPDFEALLTNATYGILFEEKVLPEDNNKFLPIKTKLQSFAQTNSFETKAQVTQILFNSAVFRGIGASQIYLDLSKVQYEAVIANSVRDVKKAFYGVLLSREILNITKASLANAEENLANIKALNQQGFTSDFDALQVEVQVENIKPKVVELENMLQSAKNGLKILLNIDQSEDIDVSGKIEFTEETFPEEEKVYADAIENNNDLKSLQIKKRVDEEFIALERSNYWPTLAAFGNYSYSGSSDKWNFQTYSSAMVGVTFSINLFMGGRASNRIEQAQIATKQTQEQINVLKDFVISQVNNKILELQKVRSQIKALNRNVELAQKAYAIASTRYKEGSGTQLEIKNADVELMSARTNLIKSVHDYIIANAELDQLLGRYDKTYTNEIEQE